MGHMGLMGYRTTTPIRPYAIRRYVSCFWCRPRISVPISAETKLGRLISGNSGTVKVRS